MSIDRNHPGSKPPRKSSGYHYLAKNIGLLTVSNFATKILSFFLVPLYTSVLTTAEYGTYDLLYNTVSLAIPLFTLNIAEGVLRFSIDDGTDEKEILHVGLHYTLVGIVIVALALIINYAFMLSDAVASWSAMILLLYSAQSLLAVTSNMVRGLSRIRELAISGIVGSAAVVFLNILFLLPLHMGLLGYFLATVLGTLIQLIYLVVVCQIWTYIPASAPSGDIKNAMRQYSIPMMANSLAWWVNSVADRYIVTAIRGISENGIYAVGSKIPQILNVFQTIFNQAWTLSAVKEFDPNDSDGFYKKTYYAYGSAMVLICSMLTVIDRPLARILYASDFFPAWKYVPFLMIGMVFGALSGHIGGVFAAVKESALYAKPTVIGAVANIIFNIISVPFAGALGSAISTSLSYWIVWVLRRREMKRYIHIKFSLFRDYLSYAVLFAQSIGLLICEQDSLFTYSFEFSLVLIEIFLYRGEVKMWKTALSNSLASRLHH